MSLSNAARQFRLPGGVVVSVPDAFEPIAGPGVAIDLRYASANNFVGRDLYGDFRSAFLERSAAAKFRHAVELLRVERPGWSFIVFDALRPRSVQRVLFDHVKDTPQAGYVAKPDPGSMHNFGMALDLSLLTPDGQEIQTGSHFDDFRELAQPKYESRFLDSGDLTTFQVEQRRVLRSVMERAGFLQLSHEWWHYNALPKAEVIGHFPIVE